MDSYNAGLHALLDLIGGHANEHDRTTQDALDDLQILLRGYQEHGGMFHRDIRDIRKEEAPNE